MDRQIDEWIEEQIGGTEYKVVVEITAGHGKNHFYVYKLLTTDTIYMITIKPLSTTIRQIINKLYFQYIEFFINYVLTLCVEYRATNLLTASSVHHNIHKTVYCLKQKLMSSCLQLSLVQMYRHTSNPPFLSTRQPLFITVAQSPQAILLQIQDLFHNTNIFCNCRETITERAKIKVYTSTDRQEVSNSTLLFIIYTSSTVQYE